MSFPFQNFLNFWLNGKCHNTLPEFKVVPYRFTVIHLLRTKAQVIFVRSKEHQCLIFYGVNTNTKSQTDSEFSCISISRSMFLRVIYKPVFFLAVKYIFLQKLKKMPLQTLLFSLKFYFQLSSWCLEIPMKHCLSCLIYNLQTNKPT